MSRRRKMTSRKSGGGFTLVEMMVVVAIIGILAAIVVTGTMRHVRKTRITATREQIRQIKLGLDSFYLDNGRYPSSLSALLEKPADAAGDWEPYLEEAPKDAWGNDFVYVYPGTRKKYDIISYGGDGREGGDGENADIAN